MNEPPSGGREFHFDYLDSIPHKIREHIAAVGLTYDIDDNTDDTVIEKKRRSEK